MGNVNDRVVAATDEWLSVNEALRAEVARLTAELEAAYAVNKALNVSREETDRQYRAEFAEDTKDLRDEIATLRAELEATKQYPGGMCDACCGDGKPVSGKPCMCGGTGRADDAVIHLRGELFKAEDEIATLRARIEAGIAAAVCERCKGDGCYEDVEPAHHPACDGSCRQCPIPVQVQVQCGACEGTGKDNRVVAALRGEA